MKQINLDSFKIRIIFRSLWNTIFEDLRQNNNTALINYIRKKIFNSAPPPHPPNTSPNLGCHSPDDLNWLILACVCVTLIVSKLLNRYVGWRGSAKVSACLRVCLEGCEWVCSKRFIVEGWWVSHVEMGRNETPHKSWLHAVRIQVLKHITHLHIKQNNDNDNDTVIYWLLAIIINYYKNLIFLNKILSSECG